MKLQWEQQTDSAWAAEVCGNICLWVSTNDEGIAWEYVLYEKGYEDFSLVEGRFRAKDLDAAKFEAVERALKWARKLVDRLGSVE